MSNNTNNTDGNGGDGDGVGGADGGVVKKTRTDPNPEVIVVTSESMTQNEIQDRIRGNFINLSDSNVTILSHYLHKYPKKWRADEEYFVDDVNKLIPEAFAYNLRPANALFGAMIAIFIIMLIGVFWWVITLFIKKNNKNVINDPGFVNPNFI